MLFRTAAMSGAILAASLAVMAASPASAQMSQLPAIAANERQAVLVRQGSSDCTNTTVTADDASEIGGNLVLIRGQDGNTRATLAITLSPRTTYHVFLKCIAQLGDVTTDEEGTGIATFEFPTSSVGTTFAFDIYPDGAPAGSQFQSVTVRF